MYRLLRAVKVLMVGGTAAPGFHGHFNAPYYLAQPLAQRCDLRHLPLTRDYLGAPRDTPPHGAPRRPRPWDAVRGAADLPWAVRDVRRYAKARRAAWLKWHLIDAALVGREVRRGVDIMHLQNDQFRGLPALRIADREGLPLVVTVHLPYALDPNPRRTFDQGLQPHFLRRVQAMGGHILCVSARNRDRMVEAYGLDPETMHVIRNGCQVPDEVPGPRRRRPTLLQVGSLHTRKNHQAVLEAMASLPREELDFDYWIVGGGWTEDDLRKRVKELDLEDHVRFWGRVDDETLARVYGEAHAFVLPSVSEGFALVMLDALAAGLPIVAFEDLDGVQELGHPEVMVAVQRDPVALGQGIVEALHRDWDRQEIQAVARTFSWEAVAERHIRLFEKVLEA